LGVKKIIKNKLYKKNTLKNYTKLELIEYCILLQNNIESLKEDFENQYINYMKILKKERFKNGRTN